MYAITTLLIVVALSLLVTRVATVILTATGMSRSAARFQARSAFTGAGFTTTESEDVVSHPVRRKVIMWLMFLGNAGIVAGAGTLIIGFRHGGAGAAWIRILQLAIGLLVLLFISRNRWVDRKLTGLIRRGLERWTDLPTSDMEGLVEMQGGYLVSELAVVEGDWIAGATLAELELTREGVVILGVIRPDGGYLGGPTADTRIEVGNVLVAYGFEEELSELDRRRAGPTGDAAHQLACVRHGERVAADRKRWEETEPETSPAPDVEEQPTDT